MSLCDQDWLKSEAYLMESKINQYIRSVSLCRETIEEPDRYPFNLTAVRNLQTLNFHPKVTFLVGENGTGKSTVLEAIAVAYGLNAEGGSKNFNFSSKATHSPLFEHIRIVKGIRKAQDGFFLRAESFYNLASNLDQMQQESGMALNSYGGVSLHEQSHGESFLALFMNRFGGKGIYLLDEPEAALSPTRQMALISRMHDLVKSGSQFIIATHSPILMAYPDAEIYQVDQGFEKVSYEMTEHYQVTREFLNNREKLLKILMDES